MSAWPKEGSVEAVERYAFDEHGPLLGATEVAQPDPELDLQAGSLRKEIIRQVTFMALRSSNILIVPNQNKLYGTIRFSRVDAELHQVLKPAYEAPYRTKHF